MPSATTTRSDAPARKTRKIQVKSAAPSAVRHGASRGRSSSVVEAAVAGQPPLGGRPQVEDREHDQREQRAAPERVRHQRVVADGHVEAGHQPQRPDQPAEVPVGLRAVGRRRQSWYGPHSQIGLIWTRPPSSDEHRGDGEQQAERARRLAGNSRRPDHVVGRAAAARGTACGGATPTSTRCTREQRRRSASGRMQDVRDVHARLERRRRRGTARPRASMREVAADERDGHRHARSRSRVPCPRAGRRPASSRGSPRAAPASSIVTPMQ